MQEPSCRHPSREREKGKSGERTAVHGARELDMPCTAAALRLIIEQRRLLPVFLPAQPGGLLGPFRHREDAPAFQVIDGNQAIIRAIVAFVQLIVRVHGGSFIAVFVTIAASSLSWRGYSATVASRTHNNSSSSVVKSPVHDSGLMPSRGDDFLPFGCFMR